MGAWRDERGQPRTFWARSLAENADARYLYLCGSRRGELPPYGLSEVLAGAFETRRHLVLVEGVPDLHQLRAHGLFSVAALGGTGARPQLFERLASLGVETVTLCLDNDEAGRTATVRMVEQAARARTSPALFVVDGFQRGVLELAGRCQRLRQVPLGEARRRREHGERWGANVPTNEPGKLATVAARG